MTGRARVRRKATATGLAAPPRAHETDARDRAADERQCRGQRYRSRRLRRRQADVQGVVVPLLESTALEGRVAGGAARETATARTAVRSGQSRSARAVERRGKVGKLRHGDEVHPGARERERSEKGIDRIFAPWIRRGRV